MAQTLTTRREAVHPANGPAPRPPKMTYEEFLEWLDEDTHAEWVNGGVEWLVSVSFRHTQLLTFLTALLRIFIRMRDLGEIANDPFQMKTGPNLPGRAPDILFVAKRNLHRLRPTFLDGPADLVVEIVSPDDPERDTVHKLAEYEAGGVPEYWILNQPRRQASFYQLGADGRYQLVAPDENGIYHSAVLPGLWLRLDWLWQEPLPLEMDVLRQWGLI
jgi:Uma2 family endonuclease